MASLAVLILAHEIGVPIALELMNPETRLLADGRLLSEISAKNCIPILERKDGSILTEMPVMMDWLAAQDAELCFTAPAHTEQHVRICEWMAYFASEQHKLFTLLFWPIDEPTKAAVKRRIVERFDIVEKALQDTGFLVGGRYTIADIYLHLMVRGGKHLVDGFEPQRQFPRINALTDLISARPAVQRAVREHG